MSKTSFPGGLYVAATPLGHLADITQRVREALLHCDLIFAEDTRRTQTLLQGLSIHRPRGGIASLHEHNESEVKARVLEALAQDQSVLLVSDAGTPAIADPGFQVVHAAWLAGFRVTPLPGPSAVIAALSVCGFARWPMTFWGFAPARQSARLEWLGKIQQVGGLAVIFETPHRAVEAMEDCAKVFGPNTPMLFGRELTKQHETLIRNSIEKVQVQVAQQKLQDPGSAKGEMVWVFDLGEKAQGLASQAQLKSWASMLAAEMPASAAAKCLVKMLGVGRDEAYSAVLAAGKHTENVKE